MVAKFSPVEFLSSLSKFRKKIGKNVPLLPGSHVIKSHYPVFLYMWKKVYSFDSIKLLFIKTGLVLDTCNMPTLENVEATASVI